jgi:hypothetical protein
MAYFKSRLIATCAIALLTAGCGGGAGRTIPATDQSLAVQNSALRSPDCGCHPTPPPPPPGSCPVSSSSTSDFNGTTIPAGSYIWFNAVAKIKNASGAVTFTNQQVAIQGLAPISLPDASVVAGSATYATFAGNAWTTAQLGNDKNVFIGGTLYKTTQPLRGGKVTWSGTFDLPKGASLQWQWSAAVYRADTTPRNDPNLKVLAADGSNNSGDHAGTPEAIRGYVTGGARGGGGSNWTGSYSGTFSAQCP